MNADYVRHNEFAVSVAYRLLYSKYKIEHYAYTILRIVLSRVDKNVMFGSIQLKGGLKNEC